MDALRIESMLRSLAAAPSRRHTLRLLAGFLLGSPLAFGRPDVAAHDKLKKCKKIDDKDKRQRCVKKGKKHRARHQQPEPVLTYQCPAPKEGSFGALGGDSRFAQTFTAAQSGSLRLIQIEIDKAVASTGDYEVQLLAVDSGKPTNSVLAAATIANASVPEGISTQTATFSGPPLLAGAQYAAAISRPGGSELRVDRRSGDDCGGEFFAQNPIGTGAFNVDPNDMISSVTVLV
jgi:hypothetical protein